MPESVFNVTGPADLGIFSPEPGYGADTWLSFFRATLRVDGRLSQPRLNSAGETSLSYVSNGRWIASLQPAGTNYMRFLHGTVVQVDYKCYIMGYADVAEGDRCTVSGARLEVINSQHWGSEQTELSLRYTAR